MCSHFSVKREILEDFAIKSIKELLSDPDLVSKVEKTLQILARSRSVKHAMIPKVTKGELAECERKIGKITEAIEEGGLLPSLLKRLKDLELRKAELERVGQNIIPVDFTVPKLAEIQKVVAGLVLGFEKKFESAPIEEKKLLVQKFIPQITIDREKRVAKCYVGLLPWISPQIEDLYENKRALTEVVSARSSGGR